MPNYLRHLAFKSMQLPRQPVRQLLQPSGIDGDAYEFHVDEYRDELQLEFAQVRELPPLLQFRLEEFGKAEHRLDAGADVSCTFLAYSRLSSVRRPTQPAGDQVLEIMSLPVEQESCKHGVEGEPASLYAALGEHHETGLGVVHQLRQAVCT